MFNLHRNWLLFAVMQVSSGSTRVFIVGHEGMPSDKNLMNTDYYLNYCYVIMEVSRPEDQQKLIDAGLTTKNPVLINGFIAEPVKKDAQAGETKPFKFTDSNSFVQTKDGSFENQYCMCSNCYHPVPTVVTVPVSQADLDKLNSGQTLEVESGEMVYACENCGNSQQKTYKNLKIWKTITGHTFSFEEAVARARKIKIGSHEVEVPEDVARDLERREMPHYAQVRGDRFYVPGGYVPGGDLGEPVEVGRAVDREEEQRDVFDGAAINVQMGFANEVDDRAVEDRRADERPQQVRGDAVAYGRPIRRNRN